MIDALKALKAQAATSVASMTTSATTNGMPADGRPNRYPGKCQSCKGQVPGGAGYFVRSSTGKVVVFHLPGQCPEVKPAAVPFTEDEQGMYIDEATGDVWKLYIGRQSGRLQAGNIVDHNGHGAIEYVKGGLTIVADLRAAGTLRLMTQDEAAAYGRTHGFCVNCALAIEDDRSLAAGYGPVCAENNGWWYPTYEEAAQVLRRPVINKSAGKTVLPTCQVCGEAVEDTDDPCLAGTPDYKGTLPPHTI
jgi:hypothetical protein